MRINLRYVLIILALILLAATMARSQTGIDPNLPDTLRIDTLTTFSGAGGCSIPVNFVNDEELSAIEVTLSQSSTDITIDSFSFAGSRVSYIPNKDYLILNDSVVTVFILVTNQTFIQPGSGLLGTVYYSWDHAVSPQLVSIDTVTYTTISQIEYSTNFKQDAQLPFVPQIQTGFINIEATPFALDSLWMADIDATAGDEVVMDVYLYNQRNTADVSVALQFSPDYLKFDSASFAGTRGELATTRNVQRNNSIGKLYAVMSYGDVSPLPPGSGTLMRLHFTVEPTTPDTLLFIDSTTYLTEGNDLHLTLTNVDGSVEIVPFFTEGSISVSISTDVADDGLDGLPETYSLSQNYPNPFNPTTTIRFSLPVGGEVRLDVYNVLGQRVRTLVDKFLPAGEHEAVFDGKNDSGGQVATGVYFYRIVTKDFTESKKMVLIK